VDSTGAALGHVGELITDTDVMKVRYFQLRDQGGQEDIYAPVEQADLDVPNLRVVLWASASLVRGLTGSGSTDVGAKSAMQASPSGSAEGEDVKRLMRAEEEVRVGKRKCRPERFGWASTSKRNIGTKT